MNPIGQPNFFDDSLGKCRERGEENFRRLLRANRNIRKLRARVRELKAKAREVEAARVASGE